MKKVFCSIILTLVLAFSFTACGEQTEDLTQVYSDITALVDGYSADYMSYEAVLKSDSKNITLHSTGVLKNTDGSYTYDYSYEYLNKIGSGADSLTSVETGTVTGTKDQILSEGLEISDGIKVVALDLAGSFKTHNITNTGDSYVMTGYIARNTIIKNTDNLDDDIRFNYELTVNPGITEIEKLVITYVTEQFDSVTVTITFKEG